MKILCLQLLKITEGFPLNGYPVLVELAGQISRLLMECRKTKADGEYERNSRVL